MLKLALAKYRYTDVAADTQGKFALAASSLAEN